ncbi:hypothetical protein GOODEAATRI_021721 [Goodea atripinnis]|uniref:Uncharacterized protein n=1 Tax=Goodea atripinnis TaxID=208336 RepID=A0ABV0PG82_9TELE
MPGMSIHNPGQAVVPDSPVGAPVSDSQQAPGWRLHSASTVVHSTSSFPGDQSQPIVISDTPSPAVSIITIHSDSEDEGETKVMAACSGVSQRTNVISCVTVHDSHDSDSSGSSSPLSPETSSQPSQSLAIILPSVKTQPGEGTTTKPVAASGPVHINIFVVHQSVMPSSYSHTGSGDSLRRQPTYPPPVSSHSSYRLQDGALFSSAPNLYTYPASAALASVSQAVDQMQGGRPSGAYSSLALLQKNAGLALGGSAAGQYGNPQPQPFQRSSAAYQRKLNQYPPYL